MLATALLTTHVCTNPLLLNYGSKLLCQPFLHYMLN